jgi:hypothetical protein
MGRLGRQIASKYGRFADIEREPQHIICERLTSEKIGLVANAVELIWYGGS